MPLKLGLDRNIALEAIRVTETTAIAAARLMGCGDEEVVDRAALQAMHEALADMAIRATVVVGEGEEGEAELLYTGEELGRGETPCVDVALDPLECSSSTAKGGPNALACIAMAQSGSFLNVPGLYMNKIAVGGGLPDGVIDLDAEPEENLHNLAKAKGCQVSDLVCCVLERPRHGAIVAKIRAAGARIKLIPDGDVTAVIATCMPDSGIDVYMGVGGASEGVLGAAALRCIGGQFQGRLVFPSDDHKNRAYRLGIEDLQRKYVAEDLASGGIMFAATGVTDGDVLRGVREHGNRAVTHSLVMRSQTGTVRFIESHHDFDKKNGGRA